MKRLLPTIPLLILMHLSGCSTPDFLEKEYSLYNFTDEGFLSPSLVQTVGTTAYPDGRYGWKAARRVCLGDALDLARRKILRIFLHTRYGIPARSDNAGLLLGDTFQSDYPVEFSSRDYLRAEIDFRPLLDRGFIAMQDLRSRKSCTVVFRIIEDDMVRKIRETEMTFRPERLP